MNWLDPAEVEAWIAEAGQLRAPFALHGALEQFVRALAEYDGIRSDWLVWQDVARLLVRAMGQP